MGLLEAIQYMHNGVFSTLQDGCPAEMGNRQLVDVTM